MKGIAASSGIAIGNAYVLQKLVFDTEKKTVSDTTSELARLSSAKNKALAQLGELYEATCIKVGKEEAQLFEAHKLMLLDETLMGDINNLVNSENCCSEYAVNVTLNNTIEMFRNIDDEYMRERAQDIEDVKIRLLSILNNVEQKSAISGENIILFAEDLTPSDTVSINKEQVLGFVTQNGGINSHTAIMARMLGIPAIVGIGETIASIKDGDQVVLDGDDGQVHLNPSVEEISRFHQLQLGQDKEKEALKQLVGIPAITTDGHEVHICGNIASDLDLGSVLEAGSDGVGLFRTEFLFMNRQSAPDEEEQYIIYKKVTDQLEGKPLTIRTLDIGGDKNVDYLGVKDEENPFLGCRAIRLCFLQEEIFRTQLRAILRASAFGPIKVMFPMISGVQEFQKAKSILDSVQAELDQESVRYDRDIKVGIMIEIPSAAIMSDILAKEADFFSIGTNDLIQYSLAVDRMNTSVEELYTPYNPAVLRLIKMVIDNAHAEGSEVGMCGEAASDALLIPLLIGFGLDEFSMSASSVLKSKQIIRNLSKCNSLCLSNKVLKCTCPDDVKAVLLSF